jgi:hypothetical protein
MPHRVDPAVPLVFQLLSNGDHGQGITWGPNDRDVQASDVYSDFGQVSVDEARKAFWPFPSFDPLSFVGLRIVWS